MNDTPKQPRTFSGMQISPINKGISGQIAVRTLQFMRRTASWAVSVLRWMGQGGCQKRPDRPFRAGTGMDEMARMACADARLIVRASGHSVVSIRPVMMPRVFLSKGGPE